MRWWPLLALVALVWAVEGAEGQGTIDNGVVELGIVKEGALNLVGGAPSCGGTTVVGIRFMPTGCDATAPGCMCEGWGLSYDGTTSGSCNMAFACPGGALTGCTWSQSASQAWSRCSVGDLRIEHHYHPTSASDLVYVVDVTIENVGPAHADVRYRRNMDWDVEPTAYNEFVTIDGPGPVPPAVATFHDNGFLTSDPLVPPGGMLAGCGAPRVYFTDCGPADHGALFDFAFGSLLGGRSLQFQTYYGAAPDEASMLAALAAVDAGIWSLGQTSVAPAAGTPNTFAFAFGGLDDVDPFFDWVGDPCMGDPVLFRDRSTTAPKTKLVSWKWTFGTASPISVGPPGDVWHTFPAAGTYPVTLEVGNDAGIVATLTKDVIVDPCLDPPVPDFTCTFSAPQWLMSYKVDRSTDPRRPLVSWGWDLGDGQAAKGRHVDHIYPAKGTYDVTLTVANSIGTAASVTKPCFVDLNLPPDVAPIPEQVVFEGDEVHFTVSATDPESDTLTWRFDPGPLPGNARFDVREKAFTWQTYAGQAGTYRVPGVEARDPWAGDQEAFVIHVRSGVDRPGPENADADGDGAPDAHDACPAERVCNTPGRPPQPADAPPVPDGTRHAASLGDADADGVFDVADNCVQTPNMGQDDFDGDGVGDACDADRDGDRIPELWDGRPLDNCPWTWNQLQVDSDEDGIGDACQGDVDADGVADGDDNCVWTPNAFQRDTDGDGRGDACQDEPVRPAPADLDGGDAGPRTDAGPQAEAALLPMALGTGGVLVVAIVVALLLLRRRE